MKSIFRGKDITGMSVVLPQKEVFFEEEIDNYSFTTNQSLKLKKIMGYEKHYLVNEDTTVSDLCLFGLQHLFEKGYLNAEDIDGLVLVTQSPDHFIPPTSNVIQGLAGLRKDILCLDINQGCAGFLVGLMQAFMMLDLNGVNKVVLLNADILSKKISKRDRNSFPQIGDAASITVVEKTESQDNIYFNLYMDGSRCNSLIIPAGGFRKPSNLETAVLYDVGDGNFRSLDNLAMDGISVFNFIQTEVPGLIDELTEYAGCRKEDIDYFFFHQPNKFILEKLADRINVSRDKMPMNVVSKFGNSSSVTIPVNIVSNFSDRLVSDKLNSCLAGFGSGLTWSSMLLRLGNFDFCEMVISSY